MTIPTTTEQFYKRICIDFDGVVVDYARYPQIGDVIYESIAVIRELLQSGHEVWIFSARPAEQIWHWFFSTPFLEDIVKNPNFHVTNTKVPAPVYIDDRAIRFEGNWDKVLAQLEQEPWWADQEHTVPSR